MERGEIVNRLYDLQERAWPLFTQGEYHAEVARMFPRMAKLLIDDHIDAWALMTDGELDLLLSETSKMAAHGAYPGTEVT